MGQKVHPVAFRMPLNKNWRSRWFATGKNYSELLLEDINLRKFLMAKLKPAGIARVVIERSVNQVSVIIFVSKPGMVIGRGGAGVDELKKIIDQMVKGKIKLDIQEVSDPDLDPWLIGRTIADQVERRMPVKRVLNQAVERAKKAGVKGIKILASGRIGGAEIARREKISFGVLPLGTLREEIDFASVEAKTATAGVLGIKVWVCRDKNMKKTQRGNQRLGPIEGNTAFK